MHEIHDLIGAREEEIVKVSAREGIGIPDLLEAIVARVRRRAATATENYRGSFSIPSTNLIAGL